MKVPVSMFSLKRHRRTAALLLPLSAWQMAGTLSALTPDFYQDVFPFLKANCISCHNKTTTKAGLNMETPGLMKQGGDSGPAIIPGKGAESLVVLASQHKADMEMPPKNNKSGAVDLTPAELEILKVWIDQGAKDSVQQERQVVLSSPSSSVDPIYTVAMTRDGRYAVCGRSNHIHLYDLAQRKFVGRLTDGLAADGSAHRALVQTMDFSPDGMRLASGSFREVKIWKREAASAAAALRELPPALGVVLTQPLPDGGHVVAVDKSGAILIVKAADGALVKKTAAVGTHAIRQIRVSPDGAWVALLDASEALHVWSLKSLSAAAPLTPVAGAVSVMWASDSRTMVTTTKEGVMQTWTLTAGGPAALVKGREFKAGTSLVVAMLPGPNPDQVFAAHSDGKVRLWNLPEGKALREFAIRNVGSLALSPDGKVLACGGQDGITRLWDLPANKPLPELRGSAADPQQLARLNLSVARQALEQEYQRAQVARLEAQNKALDELLKRATETIASIKKSLPEKQKALQPARDAAAASRKARDEVLARIASAPPTATGKPDPALEKERLAAEAKLDADAKAENSAQAALTAAERNIADAQTEEQRIAETKARNLKEVATVNASIEEAKKAQATAASELAALHAAPAKPAPAILSLRFSGDSQQLATTSVDGTCRVWTVPAGVVVYQETFPGVALASIEPRRDGTFTASTTTGGRVTLNQPLRWKLERVLENGAGSPLFADRVNAVRFSPDGKLLATGSGEPSRSGDISVFEVSSGKLLHAWKEHHEDSVLCLDFSPDGKLLASGAADKLARVTEVATGRKVNLFEGHTHHVMGIAFRADGRVLATAGADGIVTTWDMGMGERIRKIPGWTKEVTSVQFIGSTSRLLTSSGDNRVRIFNDSGSDVRVMAGLPDFMQSAASTPDGVTIIAGGEDSVLRLWDGASGRELAVFSSTLPTTH